MLVMVLRMEIVTMPLLSVAVGVSNVQAVPICTVLLVLLVQSMTGGVVSMTVTVWLHVALLLQPSIACQTRVASKVLPQWLAVLVTVLRMVIVTMPLLSVAVGVSKVHGVPICTVLLVLLVQSITGAVVSITVTVWLQVALLLQLSIACHTRVASKVLPQWPAVFVTVLTTSTGTLPLLLVAVGVSKVQTVPICTVLLVLLAQFMTGVVASITVTVWLQVALLLQPSRACQTRVASKALPQWPAVLVTVLRMVMVTMPLLSVAVGASKSQAVPTSTILLVLPVQSITGGVVSMTVTVWLQVAALLQPSMACHMRVASKVFPQW